MRISDWSSDVCSSDLPLPHPPPHREKGHRGPNSGLLRLLAVVPVDHLQGPVPGRGAVGLLPRPARRAVREPRRDLPPALFHQHLSAIDRKSVVKGKRVSVRLKLGGSRNIKKNKKK